MHTPFELVGPLPRDNEHRQLSDARGQRTAEAEIFAELGETVEQLGAAKKRDERPFDSATRARGELLGDLALPRIQHFDGQRWHPVYGHLGGQGFVVLHFFSVV
jgi:hypothetical protein